MRTYADSSFLLSLYIRDANHFKAITLVQTLQKPLSPLTPFHRLELRNGLAQQIFRDQMTHAEVDAVWANIESDGRIFAGGQAIDWFPVMLEAERLSVAHTPVCGTRSLDIIHVAIARELGVQYFISFDDKQRRVAKRTGLNVLPVNV